MTDFFSFYTQLKPENAFQMFDFSHIVLLLCLTIAIISALHVLKRVKKQTALRVIRCLALAVVLLELSHTVWLYFCGETQLIKLLPLHLCSMQSIFIPLAVFTEGTRFKDFVYATAVLGGIFGIGFPEGVAGSYPIFHYQTIQTALLHGLLVLIPFAFIAVTDYRPNLKRFPGVLKLFACVTAVAALVDFSFGQNYMFLMQAPGGTPLVWVYDVFGRGVYWLTAFLVLCGASMAIHLPFQTPLWHREKHDEQVKQTGERTADAAKNH